MKIAVVGAGIAGLASAVRLAAKGHQVEVFEANNYPGGKLSAFEINGFRFDTGPSLFTLPHLVNELFEAAGEKPEEHFQYLRLPHLCNYFFPDGTFFQMPSNPDHFAENWSLISGEKTENIKAFIKESARVYRITAPVFLEKSLHSIKTYTSATGLTGIANLWNIHMFETMHQMIQRYFKDPRTVQLFLRYATYNGSNPYQAPGTLNVIPHLEMQGGAWFPKGGMIAITESIYALAQRCGVKFHFNSTVERIHYQKNIEGITTKNQGFIPFDAVVSNMDVRPTYLKLLQKQLPKKFAKAENSSSALIFYWGINKSFANLDLHNIFFTQNYPEEFNCLFSTKTIYHDPTVYVNISSKYQSTDAPENAENWFVMINAPANVQQDWDTLIPQARENILQKLSKALNTEIAHLIQCESILDPRTIELKTSSDKGSLYGNSSNAKMSAFFRQANFSSSIKGLYFCGGSVHPGGGIPLCLMGAKIVSNLIPSA